MFLRIVDERRFDALLCPIARDLGLKHIKKSM
jgi:hypothetical protein